MEQKIIFSIIVAMAIAVLVVDIFSIIIKLNLFRTRILAKADGTVNLRGNLWVASIVVFIISYYFLAF